MQQPIGRAQTTIAIIGGGIGGLCTAILLGRAGYDVQVFEQAPQFSEIGAGIALGYNALRAFHLMGIGDAYEKVADVSDNNAKYFIFRKWDTGEVIGDVITHRYTTVHRARALECLIAQVPSNVTTHFSAQVTAVDLIQDEAGQSTHVKLTVQHQNKDEPDCFDAAAVIGCDGIRSSVRAHLRDIVHDRVRYTGTYAYRGLVDMHKAAEVAEGWVREPHIWIGKDKHFLTYPIEGGTVLNIVAFVSDRSADPDSRVWDGHWIKPASRELMEGDFDGWDSRLQALFKLLEKSDQWGLHELLPLQRWTVDRIALLGDSAHAALPHNGAGAGQAVEDAYVLGKLLEHPSCTAQNIAHFLRAYESVRRPRASRQQTHTRETGEIYELIGPAGNDYKKTMEALKTRWDWIWNHDLEADVAAAFALLREPTGSELRARL